MKKILILKLFQLNNELDENENYLIKTTDNKYIFKKYPYSSELESIIQVKMKFKAFIETRDVATITQFISAKGVLNPEIDKEIFEKINALISIYKETSGFKVKEEEAKTDKPKKKATEAPKSKDNRE